MKAKEMVGYDIRRCLPFPSSGLSLVLYTHFSLPRLMQREFISEPALKNTQAKAILARRALNETKSPETRAGCW
jgi:hypothetical protein